MPSIIYPITRDYRAQRQLWDSFRDRIWQEFLDLAAVALIPSFAWAGLVYRP